MAPSKIGYASDHVTDFVINKGNGAKGLSETGIKAIPKQYIQPLEERSMNKVIVGESIPIIDVSKLVSIDDVINFHLMLNKKNCRKM